MEYAFNARYDGGPREEQCGSVSDPISLHFFMLRTCRHNFGEQMKKKPVGNSRNGRPKPGDVYQISDPPYGYYYAAVSRFGDSLFFDKVSASPMLLENLNGVKFFLRLHVAIRAPWSKIGSTPITAELAQFGKYCLRPIGDDQAYVLDGKGGKLIPATKEEAAQLETSAVWDGEHHILPILRYHFFRVPHPLVSKIKGPL